MNARPHAPSNGPSNGPILVAAVVVLVAAAAGLFFMLGEGPEDPGAADVEATDTAAEPVRELGDVDLAPSGAGPDAGASESTRERADAVPAETEEEEPLDGRAWKDLLLPIDHLTGTPVEDVVVVHVAKDGSRREATLAAAVRVSDLEEGTLAALDSDEHAPRFFFPEDLAGRVGGPTLVRMLPTGRVRVELHADVALGGAGRNSIYVGLVDPSQSGGFNSEERTEGQQIEAISKSLRHMLTDASDDRWRRRQVKWLARNDVARTLIGLFGDPVWSGWTEGAQHPLDDFPVVFDDVPVGGSVAVVASSDLHLAIDPAPDDGWALSRSERLEIERAATATVTLSLLGSATVKGELPHDATEARVRLMRRVTDNGFMWERDEELGEDLAFVLEDLAPREYTLEATWRAGDGASLDQRRTFELEAGEVLDLGLLDGDTGATLMVVPVIVVDGVELAPEETGLFAEGSWSLYLQRLREAGASVDGWRTALEAERFEPTAVRGLELGRYHVSVGGVELPEAIAGRYRISGSDLQGTVDLAETAELRIRLQFVSASPCTVAVHVPGSKSRTSRFVSAFAVEAGSGAVVHLEFEDGWADTSRPEWDVETEIMLSPGEWTLHVAAKPNIEQASFDPATSVVPPSWYGEARVVVGEGPPPPVTVLLDLAAAVVVVPPADSGNEHMQWVTLALDDGTGHSHSLWSEWRDSKGPLVVTALPPNEEFSNNVTDTKVRSGPAGTVETVVL